MAKRTRTKKTKVIDKGYNRIIRSLKLTDKSRIETGFFQGAKVSGSNFTIPEIAAVNEFGSRDGHIPERSFMRTTFDENRIRNIAFAKQQLSDVITGKRTVLIAMDRLGIKFRDDIKLKITEIKTPPNALGTIEDKGFDNPLINTGTMRSRVTFKKIIR